MAALDRSLDKSFKNAGLVQVLFYGTDVHPFEMLLVRLPAIPVAVFGLNLAMPALQFDDEYAVG